MKAILVALAGFAASAMGHGFVYNFTTDGKFNQGFLGTPSIFPSFHLSIYLSFPLPHYTSNVPQSTTTTKR